MPLPAAWKTVTVTATFTRADTAGLDLLHHSGRFETASIQFMGPRKVCKPDLGNRMFFAGVRADSTIATHNIRNKPLEEIP